jgi:hypothetical protein
MGGVFAQSESWRRGYDKAVNVKVPNYYRGTLQKKKRV